MMSMTTQQPATKIVEQMEMATEQRVELEEQLRQQISQSARSVPQLARAANISHPSLYNWINHRRPLKLETLRKIAEAMD